MSLNAINLYAKQNKIFMENEIIFDYEDYTRAFDNIGNENDDIFCTTFSNLVIDNKEIICGYFIELFNNILINNIANYMIDLFKQVEVNIMTDDYKLDENLDVNSKLDFEIMYKSIIDTVIKSEEYGNNILKINFLKKDKSLQNKNFEKENLMTKEINNDIKHKFNLNKTRMDIKYFIKYQRKDVKVLSDRLKQDLLEFDFVKGMKKDNHYILPVYIEEEKLIRVGYADYKEYLPSWSSFAYISMLEKIHDYFKVIYGLDLSKGLQNDDLSVALIGLLDYEIKAIPKGVKKSVEVGRQSTGKCFFINEPIVLGQICQELLTTLRAKDAFGITPKIIR